MDAPNAGPVVATATGTEAKDQPKDNAKTAVVSRVSGGPCSDTPPAPNPPTPTTLVLASQPRSMVQTFSPPISNSPLEVPTTRETSSISMSKFGQQTPIPPAIQALPQTATCSTVSEGSGSVK